MSYKMSYKKAIDKLSNEEKKSCMVYDNISDAVDDGLEVINIEKSEKSKHGLKSNNDTMIETELDFKLMAIMDNLCDHFDNIEENYKVFLHYMKKNIKCDLYTVPENDDIDDEDFFYQ